MEPQEKFVEDFGLFFEAQNLNRTAGRIFGWLLICTPAEQTLDDLTDALQMAKSTVSTSARFLDEVGMVERVSKPGIRKDFYRIRPGFWEQALKGAMSQFAGFKQFAERGMDLVADDAAPEQVRVLKEMHSVYSFFSREFPALLEQWEREHREALNDES
ncbi:MAG: MarR family transcriptional regulator [Chloroflexi bacterium]|nr:MarR family transcriptional regulator [Chloroflexota bacterium]